MSALKTSQRVKHRAAVDDDASWVHLSRNGLRFCGSTAPPHPCPKPNIYEPGMACCPKCGAAVCPACVAGDAAARGITQRNIG